MTTTTVSATGDRHSPRKAKPVSELLVTTRRPLAQLVFCQGCCCGRTDRGHPEVPVERLKAVWKEEKLNKSVQLTISGCLGPCDLTNVTLVITPAGNEWLGGLAGNAVYEALIAWARECHRGGRLVSLPSSLDALRFERFDPRGDGL
jgi:hypothetical protein